MGSKIAGGMITFIIEASDGNSEKFDRIELLKNSEVIKTWIPNSKNPLVTITKAATKGDYYYVRVRQSDKNEAISSPIFISADAT